MHIGYSGSNVPIFIGQQRIDETERFTYLSSTTIMSDGDAEHNVTCQIRKALSVYQPSIWWSHTISLRAKIHLLNAIVILMVTYTSKTWKLTTSIERRQRIDFHQRCLRQILWISYRDRITLESPLVDRLLLNDGSDSPGICFISHKPNFQKRQWHGGLDKTRIGCQNGNTCRNTCIKDRNTMGISWEEAETHLSPNVLSSVFGLSLSKAVFNNNCCAAEIS